MATRVAVLIPFLRHGTRPFLWLLRGFLSWEIMCHKVSHFSSRAKQQENQYQRFLPVLQSDVRQIGKCWGLGWWDSLAQVPSQGCSDACTVRTQNILATQPCEDQPTGDVWKEFWDGYLVDSTCLLPPIATSCFWKHSCHENCMVGHNL